MSSAEEGEEWDEDEEGMCQGILSTLIVSTDAWISIALHLIHPINWCFAWKIDEIQQIMNISTFKICNTHKSWGFLASLALRERLDIQKCSTSASVRSSAHLSAVHWPLHGCVPGVLHACIIHIADWFLVVFISTCLVTVTPQCILFAEMIKKG